MAKVYSGWKVFKDGVRKMRGDSTVKQMAIIACAGYTVKKDGVDVTNRLKILARSKGM